MCQLHQLLEEVRVPLLQPLNQLADEWILLLLGRLTSRTPSLHARRSLVRVGGVTLEELQEVVLALDLGVTPNGVTHGVTADRLAG